jgi:chromosome segregation ATPase
MTETAIQLKRIQTKLQQLAKQYAALQKENNALKEELQVAKKHITVHQDTIDNLKQQVDVLRYSNGEMSGADKKEFEKKINFYVKEIDRCITMLSR